MVLVGQRANTTGLRQRRLEVNLPDERVTVIEPAARPAVPDPRATLLQAIRSPLERAPIRDIVRAGQKVAISVCDITRATASRDAPGTLRGDAASEA